MSSAISRLFGPILLGVISYLLCIVIPTRAIAHALGLFIPASGTAIFGGLTMVLWIVFSELLYGYGASIITSLTLIGLLLVTAPWYGVVKPPWFSLVGLISVIVMGTIIYVGVRSNRVLIASGLSLLSMHFITWLFMSQIGIINLTTASVVLPLLALTAYVSGLFGGVLARIICDVVRGKTEVLD